MFTRVTNMKGLTCALNGKFCTVWYNNFLLLLIQKNAKKKSLDIWDSMSIVVETMRIETVQRIFHTKNRRKKTETVPFFPHEESKGKELKLFNFSTWKKSKEKNWNCSTFLPHEESAGKIWAMMDWFPRKRVSKLPQKSYKISALNIYIFLIV